MYIELLLNIYMVTAQFSLCIWSAMDVTTVDLECMFGQKKGKKTDSTAIGHGG